MTSNMHELHIKIPPTDAKRKTLFRVFHFSVFSCSLSKNEKDLQPLKWKKNIVQTKITDNLLSSCFSNVHPFGSLFIFNLHFILIKVCGLVQSHTPTSEWNLSHWQNRNHITTDRRKTALSLQFRTVLFVPFGMVHFIVYIILFNVATTAIWHAICCMLSIDSKFKTALELNGKLYLQFQNNFKWKWIARFDLSVFNFCKSYFRLTVFAFSDLSVKYFNFSFHFSGTDQE